MIDVHQHTNWQGHKSKDLIAYMDSLGVDKAWLLSWEAIDGGLDPNYRHLTINSVYKAYSEFPDRFIPFAGVDPRRERAEEILQEWADKGFKGYGEHKLRLCIDNPDAMRMYRLCGELHFPVLVHIGGVLPGLKFWYNADVDGLERVLKKCPKTIFVGHGPGFWREISSDAGKNLRNYPKGPVTPGGKLPRLLAEYENLYADISAGSGLGALTRDPEFTQKFIAEHWPKLLYGTDGLTQDHIELLKSLSLDEQIFQAITHNNASSLIDSEP